MYVPLLQLILCKSCNLSKSLYGNIRVMNSMFAGRFTMCKYCTTDVALEQQQPLRRRLYFWRASTSSTDWGAMKEAFLCAPMQLSAHCQRVGNWTVASTCPLTGPLSWLLQMSSFGVLLSVKSVYKFLMKIRWWDRNSWEPLLFHPFFSEHPTFDSPFLFQSFNFLHVALMFLISTAIHLSNTGLEWMNWGEIFS